MRRLVVAVHDVAPEHLDDVRFLLDALDRAGVHPQVLKVIPQDLPQSRELVRLLQEEQAHGSEIVLHGFSHRVSGRFRGPWLCRLRASIFAPKDAEFLTLAPAEMVRRVIDGRGILRQAGLNVAGFCAPAWLATGELRPALSEAGFRYQVTMTALIDVHSGRRIRTGWLGYMGAGAIQERLVSVASALNRRGAPLFQVMKIFLHPQGAHRSAACRRILDMIPVMMRNRMVMTYGRLRP